MKPKPLPKILYLAGLALALIQAGCGQRETRVETGNRDQILHRGNGAEPESLDPHMTTGVPEYRIISALLEGLVTPDPKTLAPRPGVAERWEVSDDGLVYTFHFNPDAKWSNGDPVTAGDFVFSFRRILTASMGAEYAYMLYGMRNARAFHRGEIEDFGRVGAEALDDRTLRITLETPAPYFLSMLTHYSWFPVHPPTVKATGAPFSPTANWTEPGNYVGNGPFVLDDWQLNRVIGVRKSETYWNRDAVRLKGIRFYPIDQADTEERMYRSGQLHVTSTVPLGKIPQLKGTPDFQSHPYLTTYYYLINTTKPPFDDVRVRRALSLAINRRQITENILKAGQVPARHFTPPGAGGHTPDARIEGGVEAARVLLAEAGYPDGEGFPEFELLYNSSEAHRTIAEAVQQMWKTHLGVSCALVNQEWATYMETRRALNYDVARAGWAGDYNDPNNFLDLFLSESGNNNTGWARDDYDALIRQAAETRDPEARFAIFDQAEAMLLADMPIIPIYFYVSTYLKRPEVRGWHPNVLDQHPYTAVWLEADSP